MAGLWQRAMEFLGLSDGDSYAEYDAYEDQGPSTSVRRSPQQQVEQEGAGPVRANAGPIADSGVSGVTVQARSPAVRTITAVAQQPRVHTTAPHEFSDCQEIGERFRSGQPVIVNLGDVDRELTRRIVDFASGLVFGLNGKMQKAGEKVYLLTPSNVEVSADEKRKLLSCGRRVSWFSSKKRSCPGQSIRVKLKRVMSSRS